MFLSNLKEMKNVLNNKKLTSCIQRKLSHHIKNEKWSFRDARAVTKFHGQAAVLNYVRSLANETLTLKIKFRISKCMFFKNFDRHKLDKKDFSPYRRVWRRNFKRSLLKKLNEIFAHIRSCWIHWLLKVLGKKRISCSKKFLRRLR